MTNAITPHRYQGGPCKHGHSGVRRKSDGKCVECERIRQAKWRKENPEKSRNKVNRWAGRNRAALVVRNIAYYHANKDKIIRRTVARNKENRRSNPQKRIAHNLRGRLQKFLSGAAKSASHVADVGCTLAELVVYIESRFQPGMSWDNYGEWHVDHIRPLCSFDLTNDGQLREAIHYTNLRPLWAIENIGKKATADKTLKYIAPEFSM